jgi:PIN domain nuclease of toxin-antitoxin system
MKLLLDTHALLWALAQPERLSGEARAAIADARNAVFVSAASSWEIEIKTALGKLRTPPDLEAQLTERRFLELPIRLKHALALRRLPLHHRDPFDRMLVAQAMVEGLTLVTSDEQVLAYSTPTMRA